ncbi:nuclease-related domain-containing DEAD/DEAH box helicase [Aquipuribacter nitratireducens]|uniref:NERD domain-containing protein n=1 Tax=Aquipuribacter nitratireducens TaxID=650104 RepID=A0ABW0GHB5_9MICO
MAARCIPEQPSFASDAERVVWERLREQLPDDAVLFANRRLTDRDGDCEADLVVAWPDVGLALVEVKGGHVALDVDGRWHQTDRHDDRSVDPVLQAQRCRYALREYLDQHPRWSAGHVRAQHVVAFPWTRVPEDRVTTDCPRWRVLDQDDLAHAARQVAAAVAQVGHERVPDAGDVALLVECLVGRGVSQRELLAGEVDAHETQVDLLTEQQAKVLDYIAALRRVEVRGGAGSGKTWLAVEKARRLAKDKQRVALLSYSRGLAMYLRARCDQLPQRERPAYVGTFHELALTWGAERGPDDDPQYPT